MADQEISNMGTVQSMVAMDMPGGPDRCHDQRTLYTLDSANQMVRQEVGGTMSVQGKVAVDMPGSPDHDQDDLDVNEAVNEMVECVRSLRAMGMRGGPDHDHDQLNSNTSSINEEHDKDRAKLPNDDGVNIPCVRAMSVASAVTVKVPVTVNTVVTKAVVDTGAEGSVNSKAFFDKVSKRCKLEVETPVISSQSLILDPVTQDKGGVLVARAVVDRNVLGDVNDDTRGVLRILRSTPNRSEQKESYGDGKLQYVDDIRGVDVDDRIGRLKYSGEKTGIPPSLPEVCQNSATDTQSPEINRKLVMMLVLLVQLVWLVFWNACAGDKLGLGTCVYWWFEATKWYYPHGTGLPVTLKQINDMLLLYEL